MNYFAHGRHFVDRPYYLAGTALPDWLGVLNRRIKVRSRHAEPYLNDADPAVADFAAGVRQHHADDLWFHGTPAFSELSWGFTAILRDCLDDQQGFRPSFLGHILVELLLDATLTAEDPDLLERYYQALAELEPERVEQIVNRMAPRPVERLAELLPMFIRERFLWDYLDDRRLVFRLNQVMRRVKLPQLPDAILEVLPELRRQVAEHRQGLLVRPV